MMTTPKLIIFTDLDGTLLDQRDFSFEAALPSINLINKKEIPLIFASSKTRAEIELYRKRLRNHYPFISENGGGVFIPKHYFSFTFSYDREKDGYFVIEFGEPYSNIIKVFEKIRNETGIKLRGFSDLSPSELVSLCGFSRKEALLAKIREYSEPFIIKGSLNEMGLIKKLIKKKINEQGMKYTWTGRFHYLLGENDKGKAVNILKDLYKKQYSSIVTIGIGDGLNDVPMLKWVDYPIFLEDKRTFISRGLLHIKNLKIFRGRGPEVWNEAVLSVIREVNL